MKVGLFYGSTTGNTARVADLIRAVLGNRVTVCQHIKKTTPEEFLSCDGLILGVSTWEEGLMQEHFRDFLPELDQMNLRGKTVALFGLGNQQGYSGRFLDALGTLYAKVRQRGATIVGEWPIAGYRFVASAAVVGDKFVGLALDEDSQAHLTQQRIEAWVASIQPFFE